MGCKQCALPCAQRCGPLWSGRVVRLALKKQCACKSACSLRFAGQPKTIASASAERSTCGCAKYVDNYALKVLDTIEPHLD